MEFDKFYIKKKAWYSVGNFKIFNDEDQLQYTVESNPWAIKKKFFMKSVHNDVLYEIEAKNLFGTSYDLIEKERVIAHIESPLSFSGTMLKISTIVTEPFDVRGNVWRNEYKLVREEEEFAIVSYKMWSSGDFGIAIRHGEPIPLILSVVVILGHLKANGAA
ncbi:MAG: hypothetical protein HKN67_03220 [Saprospiraceae bacterium]|nr:hypothetical protein [Saprospiraceae bacterium]